MRKILCWLGFHEFICVFYYPCDSSGIIGSTLTGMVCQRCKEQRTVSGIHYRKELLAKFFSIDQVKVEEAEKERQAILDNIRKQWKNHEKN